MGFQLGVSRQLTLSVYCGKMYRYERFNVECHMDPNIGKTTVQYPSDDEVKDDAHGVFTSEMIKLPQATWIETFLEGVTDKSTGLPLFSELA